LTTDRTAIGDEEGKGEEREAENKKKRQCAVYGKQMKKEHNGNITPSRYKIPESNELHCHSHS
jgi:hypothetical protein